MPAFIETLEGRQMLSVSHPALAPLVSSPAPIHMTPIANTAMVFQGQSLNADGSFAGDIQMALTPAAGKTYTAKFTVINSNGSVSNQTAKVNANGQLSFTQTSSDGTLTVQGQLSANIQSFTATWSHSNANGTQSGTASLARTSLPIAKAGGMNFAGSGAAANGQKGKLTAFVLPTASGYWVSVQETDPGGNTGGILLPMNSAGQINYTGANNGSALTITAQMTGKTITGAFTTHNPGGGGTTVTFTLKQL